LNRIFTSGVVVGAFVLTLAFSYRHDGLLRPDPAPSTRVAVRPPEIVAMPTGEAAPAAAATIIAPPDIAPPDSGQSEQNTPPDVDNGEMRSPRERAADHGARSR
jgi:hypothetical protein